MFHQLRILGDGRIDILLRGAVNIIMTLHTNSMDRHTCINHFLHHIIDTVALARVALIVVVVEQQSIGVGLMSELKRLGYELIPTEFVERALTIRVGLMSRP